MLWLNSSSKLTGRRNTTRTTAVTRVPKLSRFSLTRARRRPPTFTTTWTLGTPSPRPRQLDARLAEPDLEVCCARICLAIVAVVRAVRAAVSRLDQSVFAGPICLVKGQVVQ